MGVVQIGPSPSARHLSSPDVTSTAYRAPSSHPNKRRLPEREGVESIGAPAWNFQRSRPVLLSRAYAQPSRQVTNSTPSRSTGLDRIDSGSASFHTRSLGGDRRRAEVPPSRSLPAS